MSYSSERKQVLIGWYLSNVDLLSNTQLQKFLFFYELFSKIDGDSYELDDLKIYKNEPVFSTVFSDMKYDDNFKDSCSKQFQSHSYLVNTSRAKLADFLVKCLGNKLSEFTYKLNIWTAKCAEVEQGKFQVPLHENNFTEDYAATLRTIEAAYPESYIDSIKTYSINDKIFIYFKADEKHMSDKVHDILYKVSLNPEFDSPIYISFSETGELLLD